MNANILTGRKNLQLKLFITDTYPHSFLLLSISHDKIGGNTHRLGHRQRKEIVMNLTRFKNAPFILSALMTAGSASAQISVGAYAVANHSACGAGSIPGTIVELDKFFASENFGAGFTKNFYWTEARVKNSEWTKDGDYRQSSETIHGFDGSDASVLTYIASHGVTSGGVYKALAGSSKFGGCYIPTSSLELGNNQSRYTILSTCQGLKIGTGDNPTSAGENPSRTWKTAAKGLNCIFGYSNNMADADQYGEYLLANIKDGQTPLSKAFMDASESVSTDNIPAVMCFGSTEQDAADYLANNTIFESESRAANASSWVYRRVQQKDLNKSIAEKIPAVLRVSPAKINAGKVASTFLGAGLKSSKSNNSAEYTSESGSVTYRKETGTLVIKNNLVADIKSADVPSATEAEEIAARALKISGLSKSAGDLIISANSEDVLGSESGAQKVASRKVTFKQVISGHTTLSQQGSIDVTVGPGGSITEIKAAILNVDPSFKTLPASTNLASRMEDIEATAIRSVSAKSPGGNYRVLNHRIGYDAGNFMKARSIVPSVVEVTVEATQGEFSRRYIEKINL
jgi:hypothetical protein